MNTLLTTDQYMFNKQEDKISNDAPKQTNKKTRKKILNQVKEHI